MRRNAAVWRWQLMLAFGTAIIAILIAGVKPAVFGVVPVTLGFIAIVVITIVSFLVPWQRLSPAWIVVIPIADIFAIGLASSTNDIRLAFLWVFPIAWIASHYSLAYVFGSIVAVGACLIALSASYGTPVDTMLRVLITVLSLGFLGTSIGIGTQQSRAVRRLLQRQSEQMHRTASRAEAHEHRVTQIIDALDLALVTVSQDGTIRNMNDAYRNLYRRHLLVESLPSAAVEYDDRRGEPLQPDRTSLARAARGERLRNERIWLFDPDGEWRALQVSTQAIASVNQQFSTTLLIIEDVTDLLQAAEERRAMTAIVSHELRNPLTAIIGHVDLLRERDDLPERVQDQLSIIANASERMECLVVRTLDESKPVDEVLAEPVDLRQLVDASVSSFLPTAQTNKLHLGVDGADTLMLYGDAFRLRQVIDNLVSNAVKYTPAGGEVVVALGVAETGQAELLVTDTGTGISPADLTQIFQPYFRAEQAVVSDIPGTGLGMGVVHDIVTAHEGTITIASNSGVGTSVTVRLPRELAFKETS